MSTVDNKASPPSLASSVLWEGQPYSIKRFGDGILNCDSEPVQTPGCVQGHGALLVLQPDDLTILQVSENTLSLLGHAPEALLGKSIGTLLGLTQQAQLAKLLATESVERNPLYLLTHAVEGDTSPFDVMVHTIDGVVLLEFEATARTADGELDYFSLVKHSVARLQKATSVQSLSELATQEIRALTGLDRVMLYKFHEDGHGEVVAENRRPDLEPWLGLHYPAQDIPEPAREVLRQTWIRPLREIGAPLAEMVPLTHPHTGRALTMTCCALRGVSVMHTEYLQNMGVKAGLTLSIRQGDKLYGLIACHHYTGPLTVAYGVREACELLAQVISLQYQSAQEREHLSYRLKLDDVHTQLVKQAAREGGLSSMIDGTPNLLEAMDASGAAVFHNERWWRVGATPPEPELDALADWLAVRPEFRSTTLPVFASNALGLDYPAGEALTSIASGLLAIALASGRRNLVLWFRPEMIQTVTWAGDPNEKPTVIGPHGPRVTPRGSFAHFTELVRGRSVPWQPVEIETALRFRMGMLDMVVNRVDELAKFNAELARSNEELDAFAYVASHDLKEPLRGIYKYAHQLAGESALKDSQHGQRLNSMMRLTQRMDNLLDSLLHFSRVGRVALELDNVDFNEIVAEALEMVDARRNEHPTEILIPRTLPHAVCDRVRIREVFVNLFSNALKYNDKALVQIEIGYLTPLEIAARSAWPSEVAGQTVYYVKDNGIGIERQHRDLVFKLFKQLNGRNQFGGGAGAGLTIVKKLLSRHGGIIWLDSEPGLGSTFYFSVLPESKP